MAVSLLPLSRYLSSYTASGIKALLQKMVYHGAELLQIDLLPHHGQTHAAEAELPVDFREKAIVFHMLLLYLTLIL